MCFQLHSSAFGVFIKFNRQVRYYIITFVINFTIINFAVRTLDFNIIIRVSVIYDLADWLKSSIKSVSTVMFMSLCKVFFVK